MRKFKLRESQKLIVFFGGLNIGKHVYKEIEGVFDSEKMKKAEEEARRSIVGVLNNCGDIANIKDLYAKTPSIIGFNPIVFNLRVPSSLQEATRRHLQEQMSADVEDFTLVYDGGIVMVAAICPIHKRPWGVYDARDRFEELLRKVYEFESIPPCLTHEAVVFAEKELEKIESFRDIYVRIPPNVEVFSVLQRLYLSLNKELWSFYMACDKKVKIDENVMNIRILESGIVENLKNFMLTEWYQTLKKRRIMRKIRLDCIEILRRLSDYTLLVQVTKKTRAKIEEDMVHNDLFEKLVQRVNFDEYTEPETIDVNSLMRLFEHVRSELETYSVNFSVVISALIGAVIGSILTIIASHLLRLYP